MLFIELIAAFEHGITSLPTALADPSQRIFLPFLMTPMAIILIIVVIQRGRLHAWQQLVLYVSPKIWLRYSTLVDISWMSLNSALKVFLVIPVLGTKLTAAMAVAYILQTYFGDGLLVGVVTKSDWSGLLIIAVFSVLFFVVEDASRFSLHCIMHRVKWLWKFHRVHHSAKTMTPLTLFRVHPFEMTLYYVRSIIVFALLAGSFTWLFREKALVWQLLGVDALGLLFNSMAANVRHSHVYLSFGRLESWFISPAQHQLHHSCAFAHQDRNYGTCLAIWDKLLKTWLPSSSHNPDQRLSFGLSKSDFETNT